MRKYSTLSKVHILVDAIGIIGVLLAAGYIIIGSSLFGVDSPYLDLWSNLSIEVVSIWIGVRLIDALISAREKRVKTRSRIVRNMRFLLSVARRLTPKSFGNDLVVFKNELAYTEKLFVSWKKYLSNDEIKDVLECHKRLNRVLNLGKAHYELHIKILDASMSIDKRVNIDNGISERRIYRSDVPILRDIDSEYSRFIDRPNYDFVQLQELISHSLEPPQIGLSPPLLSHINLYKDLILDLGPVRTELSQSIEYAEEAFRAAEVNIFEEHDEDI